GDTRSGERRDLAASAAGLPTHPAPPHNTPRPAPGRAATHGGRRPRGPAPAQTPRTGASPVRRAPSPVRRSSARAGPSGRVIVVATARHGTYGGASLAARHDAVGGAPRRGVRAPPAHAREGGPVMSDTAGTAPDGPGPAGRGLGPGAGASASGPGLVRRRRRRWMRIGALSAAGVLVAGAGAGWAVYAKLEGNITPDEA